MKRQMKRFMEPPEKGLSFAFQQLWGISKEQPDLFSMVFIPVLFIPNR